MYCGDDIYHEAYRYSFRVTLLLYNTLKSQPNPEKLWGHPIAKSDAILQYSHENICFGQKQPTGVFYQKSVSKNLQYSRKNTCGRVSFSIKLKT